MALRVSLRRAERLDGSDPDGWIRESYSRILATCVYAGLGPAEADDVAQDIWVWLLRQGAEGVYSMPWLSAVAKNFVLRYRRRSYRRSVREGRALDDVPEPQNWEEVQGHEINELLNQVAAHVNETERQVLELIRKGYSLAEAARMLKIPRGSRAYYHQRLIECGRRELRVGVAIPVRRGRPEAR